MNTFLPCSETTADSEAQSLQTVVSVPGAADTNGQVIFVVPDNCEHSERC
jgi:hypothetical protein